MPLLYWGRRDGFNIHSGLQSHFRIIRWLSPTCPSSKPRRKRALLIGINYLESDKSWRLSGAHEDIHVMKDFLINYRAYSLENIVTLSDNPETSDPLKPTLENIRHQLKNFTEMSSPEDDYFVLFSGHACNRAVEGDARDEEDGMDEFLIPCDATAGKMSKDTIIQDKVILDNELHDILVKGKPPGSRMIVLFDTCHSGTLLDLRHHRCNRVYSNRSRLRRIGRRLLTEPIAMLAEHNILPENVITSLGWLDRLMFPEYCSGLCPRLKREKDLANNVISISACKDSQSSYESPGRSLTKVLIENFKSDPKISLKKLMQVTSSRLRRVELTNGGVYYQDPQISSPFPLNMEEPFSKWI